MTRCAASPALVRDGRVCHSLFWCCGIGEEELGPMMRSTRGPALSGVPGLLPRSSRHSRPCENVPAAEPRGTEEVRGRPPLSADGSTR
eukprot:2883603-Heterocapsa_arctica.AAC.1